MPAAAMTPQTMRQNQLSLISWPTCHQVTLSAGILPVSRNQPAMTAAAPPETGQHDDEVPRHVQDERADREHDPDDDADHERDDALFIADDPPGRRAEGVAHGAGEDRDRRVVEQVRQPREHQGDDEPDDPAGHGRERPVPGQRAHALGGEAEPDDEGPQRQQQQEEPPSAEGKRQPDHDGQDGHQQLHPIYLPFPGPTAGLGAIIGAS